MLRSGCGRHCSMCPTTRKTPRACYPDVRGYDTCNWPPGKYCIEGRDQDRGTRPDSKRGGQVRWMHLIGS